MDGGSRDAQDHALRTLRPRRPEVPAGHDGLLLIYPLEPVSSKLRGDDADVTERPIMGFAVSFPWSPDAPMVDYVVNQRFIDELAGDRRRMIPEDTVERTRRTATARRRNSTAARQGNQRERHLHRRVLPAA